LLARHSTLVLKVVGDEAFKRRLACSGAVTNAEFVLQLKSFIANVLKCKAY